MSSTVSTPLCVQAYERREGPPSLLVFDVQLRPDAQARVASVLFPRRDVLRLNNVTRLLCVFLRKGLGKHPLPKALRVSTQCTRVVLRTVFGPPPVACRGRD